MAFSCRRKRLFHDCMFNMLFSIAGHWKPMGVKIHWEIQKGTKMETNGDEKPLGNPNKTKKQNVETNGGEKPLGNQKKTQKPKCGDQWG